jgi:hypothetical protein
MKKVTKIFALAIIMIAFSASTFAQVTASADASATIVAPIAITKVTDMDFGNVYVSATVAGTVVLATDGSRTVTGGAGLPGTAGTPSAASFTVTGTAAANFTITLPASVTISNGGNNMTVDVFESDPTSPAVLTGGSVTLDVGATLNVAAGQATGLYTTGTQFDVTVNYQ